jgi:hypothetical protein
MARTSVLVAEPVHRARAATPRPLMSRRASRKALSRIASFEIERADEEPAFTKLVYLEGSL